VFHSIEKQISELVAAYVRSRYGAETTAPLEQPKQPSFGELAIPVAFHLARQLKQAPKAIAAQIVAELGTIEGVSALEVAGNGYINVRFDRAAYGLAVLQHSGQRPAQISGKIIVEHTNINPNKAAHIGHLRNAVLGDTFVRMLRARSHTVEVQNYIDNTGVQVADVVAGFHYLRKMSYDEVVELMRTERFDYYCWDLYAEVSSHPELKEWRQHTLHAIEHREGELVHLASKISEAIVGYHLNTMARLGVTYDLLPRESDVVWLKFWETAFEQLKERQAIYFETEGKNKGCWVMPASAFKEQTGEDTEDSKVIVRSNNTVTYVGKDIAYQLWKFGLLPGKDFYYLRWPDMDVYITTAEPQPPPPHEFGHATSVYNVIEKELLKAGFTVRDRALLTEVLRNNPKIDYRAIKEKIDTQLILEIVSLSPWDYSNAEFKRVDTGAPGQASVPFKLVGSRVMAKLIMVETGEIGGIITYYAWPKDWECYFVFQEGSDPFYVRVASKAGVVDERYSWYEAPAELGAAWFIKGMLKELKK